MKKLMAILFPFLLFSCTAQEVEVKPPSVRAEGYYEIGISYLQVGEIPLALKYLFKARDLNPKSARVYNAIGVAFLKKGDLKLAEENLKKAVSLKKDFSEGYLNLGILYEKKNNLELARKMYLKALSNPLYMTPEVAYYRLALLELKEGKKDSAVEYLEKSINSNPDYVPAQLKLAEIFTEEGKLQQAKEIYYMLIERHRNLQTPYCLLGNLYLQEGRKKLAKKYLKLCVDINPASKLGVKAKITLEEME